LVRWPAGRASIRLRNEIRRSVQRTAWRLVRELVDGGGDAAPHRGAVIILLGREFIGARGAFLERLVAVALQHQVGGPPNVDLGYHAGKVASWRSPNV
jgi:hypothetical protein